MLDPCTLTMAESLQKGKCLPFVGNVGNCTASTFSSGNVNFITSLDGDKATLAYLQECVAVKGARNIFVGTEDAMRQVSNALWIKHKIKVTVADCQKKKKRLDEQHRRQPHPTWRKYMSFLRGETHEIPACHVDDQSDSMEDDVLRLVKFTKGEWY